jgi:hypothetical protein
MKVPRSRTFPTRESQDRSKVETANAVRQSGAGSHLQAQFYTDTARAVAASSSPALVALRPDVLAIREERWVRAYEFVRHFLADHKMGLALATLAVEFPAIAELGLQDTFNAVDRDEYFRELCAQEPIPFRGKVAAFGAAPPTDE